MPQSRWRSPPRDNPLSFFGADAPKAKTVYFAGTTDPAAAIRSIAADMTMHEPARLAAKQMTAAGQPAWLYRFDYVAESLRPTGSAEHAKKLPYLFGTLVTARAHHLDRGRVQQTGNVPSAFRRAWSRGRSMSSRVSFTLPLSFPNLWLSLHAVSLRLSFKHRLVAFVLFVRMEGAAARMFKNKKGVRPLFAGRTRGPWSLLLCCFRTSWAPERSPAPVSGMLIRFRSELQRIGASIAAWCRQSG
jgi:hypothetical protein